MTATEEEAADVAKPLGVAPAPTSAVASRLSPPRLQTRRTIRALRAPTMCSSSAATARSAACARVDDDSGVLTLAPMERLELALGTADAACPVTWAGYLLKDGVLGDLPVGASMDGSGTFYWQTGPGFAGRFPLLFVRTDCRGEKQRLSVVVTIPNR